MEELSIGGTVKLAQLEDDPREHILRVAAWLENEVTSGRLARSYTTATLIVAVSDSEVAAWTMSPHGVMIASARDMTQLARDLRCPVLRELGMLDSPAFALPGTEWDDKARSVFCVGTPAGYEIVRAMTGANECTLALDRGALPFGPIPARIGTPDFWSRDAGWKHGVPGLGVMIGDLEPDALTLPDGCTFEALPLWGTSDLYGRIP